VGVEKMTNDEMIRWAKVKLDDAAGLDALIWIARQEESARVWKQIRDMAQMKMDAALLSSYPGGLKKRDE